MQKDNIKIGMKAILHENVEWKMKVLNSSDGKNTSVLVAQNVYKILCCVVLIWRFLCLRCFWQCAERSCSFQWERSPSLKYNRLALDTNIEQTKNQLPCH